MVLAVVCRGQAVYCLSLLLVRCGRATRTRKMTSCFLNVRDSLRWFLYKKKYPPARTTCFGRAARAGHFFYTVTFTKFTFKVARLAVMT